MLVLAIQILPASSSPSTKLTPTCFASVEYIMRCAGRLDHPTSIPPAVGVLAVVYLHSSARCSTVAQEARELIWIFGVLIYLSLMAEAFLGYPLPWGPDVVLGRR